jgi:outer membrane biosynthesis protein TonB
MTVLWTLPLTTNYQSDGSAESNSTISNKQEDQQHPDLRLAHADVPIYPPLARAAGISGTVEIRVTVRAGIVTNTEVKSGLGMLAKSAIENIQSWRFHQWVHATFTTKFIYQYDTEHPLYSQNPQVELELPWLVKITSIRDSDIKNSVKGAK